jgi:hypothetical protein
MKKLFKFLAMFILTIIMVYGSVHTVMGQSQTRFVRDDGVVFELIQTDINRINIIVPKSLGALIYEQTGTWTREEVNTAFRERDVRELDDVTYNWMRGNGAIPQQTIQDSQQSVVSETIHQTHQTQQSQQFQPLWEREEKFKNYQKGNFTSNGQMEQSIRNFWQQHARHVNNNYSGLVQDNTGNSVYKNVDLRLNDSTRQSISQGFSRDSVQLPFNRAYIDEILGNIYFYFAQIPESRPTGYSGKYVTAWDKSYVFTQVHDTIQYQHDIVWIDGIEKSFTNTLLHELGHAMGLGEPLADLFAEEYLRLNYSVQGPNANDYLPISGSGSMAYDSTFDRSLLRQLERQGRGYELWEAAFHSNAKYQQLWDEQFAQYVTSNDLNIARRVYFFATSESNLIPGLAAQFQQYAGISIERAGQQLLRDWRIINNETHPENPNRRSITETQRQKALEDFKGWIAAFKSFANTHNLPPKPQVLDYVIESHVYRYYGYIPGGSWSNRQEIVVEDNALARYDRGDGGVVELIKTLDMWREREIIMVKIKYNLHSHSFGMNVIGTYDERDVIKSVNVWLQSHGFNELDTATLNWLREQNRLFN